jgi:hypothetical protein
MSRYGAGGPTASQSILFTPEAAKRPDSSRQSPSTDATLVIDYQLLARLPADLESAGPGQSVTADEEISTVVHSPPAKTEPTAKDREVEALRKEVEDIKRHLAEQEAQHSLSQPKQPPSPTSP